MINKSIKTKKNLKKYNSLKKNRLGKKFTKKQDIKLKLTKKLINVNQIGGAVTIEFIYKFYLYIDKAHTYESDCYNSPNPTIILNILKHFHYKKNPTRCNINGKEFGLEDLKIKKLKCSLGISKRIPFLTRFKVYHSFLAIYFEDGDYKYLLGTFGLGGAKYIREHSHLPTAVISFPDSISYKKFIENGNNITIQVEDDGDDDEDENGDGVGNSKISNKINITKANIQFLINIFYIYNYLTKYCIHCHRQINFYKNTQCPNKKCKSPVIGYELFGAEKDDLFYFKLPLKEGETLKFRFYILYNKYSVAKINGVNCQTFANLFMNLMRHNAIHFKSGRFNMSFRGIAKRIQMIKNLYDINNKFIEKNKERLQGDNEMEDIKLNIHLFYYLTNNFIITNRKVEYATPDDDPIRVERKKTELFRLFKQVRNTYMGNKPLPPLPPQEINFVDNQQFVAFDEPNNQHIKQLYHNIQDLNI